MGCFGNDSAAGQLGCGQWVLWGAFSGKQCVAALGQVLAILGSAGVILSPIPWGVGQWDWPPAGHNAFGFGDPEEHPGSPIWIHSQGGEDVSSWEGEVLLSSLGRGGGEYVPGCSPAPELWSCVIFCPVHTADSRLERVVTSDGDAPTSSPCSNPFPGGKCLLTFPQAAPRAIALCSALFGLKAPWNRLSRPSRALGTWEDPIVPNGARGT